MKKEIEELTKMIFQLKGEIDYQTSRSNDLYDAIEQHIGNLEQENRLLKRNLDNQELMRKLTIGKLQSKLDRIGKENKDAVLALEDSMLAIEYFSNKLIEIREVVDNVFKEYTQSNGKYSFSGNDLLEIKSILDKE